MSKTFHGKKVFVSGGAGVIGSSLVEKLVDQGAELFVGDLKPQPAHWPSAIRYRQGDLNDITVEEIRQFQPEYLFHLAAVFERTEESEDFWEENYRHNVQLSHHLLSCFRHVPTLSTIVFASSYLIYDPSLYLFSSPQESAVSLKEDSPAKPRNLCGVSKLYHEEELQFVSSFSRHISSVISARIFRSFGKNSQDIISRWVRAALREEEITVYNKEGLFDFIFAEDVAEGLLRLALSGSSGIFNLGSGKARRIADVLKILRQHFPNLKIKSEQDFPPFEASQATMERCRFTTGWTPSHTLEDAVAQIIAFEKSFLNLPT